ncbi:hypothetical protein SAMN02745218_01935 [Desulfofundulus australicus DSM 11792]|uniref:Uncharacterized protein n=1 Tax=Desulfofundulus australicus DSM 11792 TaxID=1121425 RepID=A0A1M5AKM8_9FIRM|nr:iron-containing alcohol dehydrogenase [Desulfofundulus australicus]SHF30860.1 hypothetical protein SAMN02745218_01935 [Desulfofundulus australicus DSM 11792]
MERPKYAFENPAVRLLYSISGASAIRGLQTIVVCPRVMIGIQAFNALGKNVRALAFSDRAMIITDKVVRVSGERVKENLVQAGFAVEIWDDALPEAPLENILRGAEVMRAHQPSVIVAVGGGSVIDTAKMVWLLYEKPDVDFRNLSPTAPLGLRKKAFLIGIPTTAGTGSEATSAAVITDGSHKIPLTHPELVPDIAVLDPRFTVSMPPQLTMWTGVDALAHAVGAYLTCNRASEYTDSFALQAIRLIFKYLPRAIEDGRDLEARQKMLVAANLAGMAFSNGAAGIDHALGHTIGKKFGLHHGLSVGVFLPYVCAFYARRLGRVDQLARELGYENGDEFIRALISFYESIGFAHYFFAYPQVKREAFEAAFDELVSWSLTDPCTAVAPVPITPDDYGKIIRSAFTGQLKGVMS